MGVSYNPSQFIKQGRADFIQAARSAPPNWISRVATYVTSDSYSEDYAWIGEAPQIAEEVEGKETVFSGMSDASYNLPNKAYSGGIEVKKDDINDEKVGGLSLRIQDLLRVANMKPNALLSDALVAGTSATDITGEAFFTATHAARGSSGTGDNLLTGTGTSVSQIQTDIGTALTALMVIKGENGEYINEGFQAVWVMVPAARAFAFREALMAPVISQTSNVRFEDFRFDLIINPRLDADDPKDWYMGIQDSSIRGLVFQDREAIDLTSQDNEESDTAFVRNAYRFKVRGRMRAGYGRWQSCLKVNNS